MPYNLEWLIDRHHSGERIKYLFFWGHQPSRDGSITASCFSQWWAFHPFIHDDTLYQSAEHWMMAEKARMFEDEPTLQLILEVNTAAEAKKLGRQVRNFDQAVWEASRFDIVVKGNIHKFSQHEDLKSFLLSTGGRVLVEASPVDKIWGIGLTKDDERAAWPAKWKGLNLLGFALMETRDQLMAK